MKKLIVVAVLAVALWFVFSSPKVGEWMYQTATDAEASFYGLEQTNIDIGEMTLAAYVGGPEGAPAMVMIHGYSADKDVWPRFAKHFLDDYRVIIPDMAGHGESPFQADWNYRYPAQAKRVAALLDALQIQQAHVIGNSMGGGITAWFARLFPQRTLSATMLDSAGITSPQRSELEQMLAQGKNPFLNDNCQEFDYFYGMTMAKPPFLPPGVIAAICEQYKARRDELDIIHKDFASSDALEDELQHLRMPTLVVWGDQDRLLDVSAVPIWAEKLPNDTVVIMEGIGHMPMVEAPKDLADIYHRFLNGLPQ